MDHDGDDAVGFAGHGVELFVGCEGVGREVPGEGERDEVFGF